MSCHILATRDRNRLVRRVRTDRRQPLRQPPHATHKGRIDLRPATKKYSALRDQAKKDPVSAKRIADTKAAALRKQAEYQLSELRQALGLTRAELAALIGKSQSAV
jgi:ribosome-binding protein aMBF1 (putative translation factor)